MKTCLRISHQLPTEMVAIEEVTPFLSEKVRGSGMSINKQMFNNFLTGIIVVLSCPTATEPPGFPFAPLTPFCPGVPFSPCLLTPGFPYGDR